MSGISGLMDLSAQPFDGLVAREWLVTNGIGGYASSTPPGLNTRKYHALLVAAMAPPVRRMVLLSRVEETLWSAGRPFELACNEYPGVIHPLGHQHLRAFSHDPFPRWGYQGDGWTIEKQLRLLRGQNTVVLTYTLLGVGRADLELRPMFALRGIHELTYQWNGPLLAETRAGGNHRVAATSRTPEVFFAHDGRFEPVPNWYLNTIYRREQERGYAGLEDLWTPGVVRLRLEPGRAAHFVCSADPIDFEWAVARAEQQSPAVRAPAAAVAKQAASASSPDRTLDALRRAADQFVVSRSADGTSDKPSACVTRYPWAPPSGRDMLIAFAGLFLVTGRYLEGRSLLLSMAARVCDGLMPSEFTESGYEPAYRGADVSLWYAHAVRQYLRYSGDDATVRRHLFDPLLRVIETLRRGGGLGVAADADGLLATRAPGTPATWMDAKVGDWVITPRTGRPVELNALWYNALCVGAELSERYEQHDRADALASLARSAKAAFNRRFWNEPAGCCFDVVDDHGPDPAVRPNQLLAVSLPFPVLDLDRHASLVEKVRGELLTPFGVRTLSPRDPGYVGHYTGNIVQRDRACHNGAAYPWLLGPYVTALARVRGRGEAARRHARELLQPCLERLGGDGLGQLHELFDGTSPHAPGGAIACATAVGEILRCYAEDVLEMGPELEGPLAAAGPADAAALTRPLRRA